METESGGFWRPDSGVGGHGVAITAEAEGHEPQGRCEDGAGASGTPGLGRRPACFPGGRARSRRSPTEHFRSTGLVGST